MSKKKMPKTYAELEKFLQEELESIKLDGGDTDWERGNDAGWQTATLYALNLLKEVNANLKAGKKWGYSFSTEGYRMQDADIQHMKFDLTYAELLEAQKHFEKNADWTVFYLPDKEEIK
jgi:hypothetical protein